MEPRRIFQTTLVHQLKPEFSLSALFVAAALPPDTNIEGLTAALGMDILSGGSISEAELKRVLTCILSGNFDVFDMNDRAFRTFVNQVDIGHDYLDRVIHKDYVVIEKGSPASETLFGLLNDSFGAALGLFTLSERARVHDLTGFHKIELLSLIMPYGFLLCGSMRGISRALHFGLYDRIYQTLMHRRFAPSAVG